MSRSPDDEGLHPSQESNSELDQQPAGGMEDSESTVHARAEQKTIVEAFSHSGPLPSEQWFRTVEELYAGATELILSDYSDERAHQREMQARAVEIDRESLRAFSRYQTLRLVIAGGIALVIAVGGVVLIAMDKPIWGLAVIVSEVAALVLAFFGRSRGSADKGEARENDGGAELAPTNAGSE